MTVKEAVEILTGRMDNKRCTKTPLEVRKNMTFLVDVSSYKNWEDIKSDTNGAYSRMLRIGTWTLDIDDDGTVEILHKKKVSLKQESELHIDINSKINEHGLCRSIFFLIAKSGTILHDTCLLQYHIAKNYCEEVKFEVTTHANRK